MAVELSSGFEMFTREPIDNRLVLSKQEMREIDEDNLPGKKSYYFAFCKDDQVWYYYNKNHTVDAETGKYRKVSSGGSTPAADSGHTSEIPDPSTKNPGDMFYDTDTGKTYIVVVNSEGNQSWQEVTPKAGEMMYDSTSGAILYFDGTQWKPIGGGVEHDPSFDPTQAGTPGEIIYDETAGKYKVYEVQKTGDAKGVWVELAKVWEGTTAEFNALSSDSQGTAWSQRHSDVICFITD